MLHVSKNTLTCTYYKYNNGNDMISCFLRMLIKERISSEIKNKKNKIFVSGKSRLVDFKGLRRIWEQKGTGCGYFVS